MNGMIKAMETIGVPSKLHNTMRCMRTFMVVS